MCALVSTTPRESTITPLPDIERTEPPPVATHKIFTIDARVLVFTASGSMMGVSATLGVCETGVELATGVTFLVTIFFGVDVAVVAAILVDEVAVVVATGGVS